MKRILTIQDISCVGKCSLTVALPIISAFGIETAVLPTAVLSNHTAFSGWTFRDLTDDIVPIENCWKKENISFNAIYTGYLGSIKQIEIVANLFNNFKPNNQGFILVDPAMADNGKLYAGFDLAYANKMTELCKIADVIVPNLTEASLLLGQEYVGENYDENYIKSTLKQLTDLGCKTAVLTGVSFDKQSLGTYAYDKQEDKYYSHFSEHIPAQYHGTGDVFASALCGSLSLGKNIKSAIKIAVDFTVESIKKTVQEKNSNWYGVNFEQAIPFLLEQIK